MRAVVVSCIVVAACARSPARPTPPARPWTPPPAVTEQPAKVLPGHRGAPSSAPIAAIPHLLPVARATVEPHFATTKVHWPEVCERRGRLPDDVLAYVATWCRHRVSGNDDQLVRELSAITESTTVGLSSAAVDDIVTLVATRPDVTSALATLRRITAVQPRDYVRLSIAYVDLDRLDDARHLLAAMPRDAANACEAKVQGLLVSFDLDARDALFELATKPSPCAGWVTRALCEVKGLLRDDEVRRTSFQLLRCSSVSPPPPAEQREALLVGAYVYWTVDAWDYVAALATSAMPVAGAEHAAIVALGNALRENCGAQTRTAVMSRVAAIQDHPNHDPQYDYMLTTLIAMTAEECAAFNGFDRR